LQLLLKQVRVLLKKLCLVWQSWKRDFRPLTSTTQATAVVALLAVALLLAVVLALVAAAAVVIMTSKD